MTLSVNQAIPVFSVSAYPEQIITQDNFKDHWTVLYFYPRDDTPGCTQESLAFQERLSDFEALSTKVIGVSRDDMKSHEKFSHKFNLTFPLICDTDETLCQLFSVLKEKTNYGKKYMGIERSTFLIDAKGIIRYEWRKVSVPEHVESVLTQLNQLMA
jgi:thioredoxin-dependent peroxiredoxin